ncbi:MAG: HAD family hydrolase [Candidatus Helarchaeota archaeon]
MKFNVILFDLDGTLIRIPKNFIEIINEIVLDVVIELGGKVSVDRINDLWISNKNHREILSSWKIDKSDHSKFWKLFDEKEMEIRKNLVKSGEMRLYEDTLPVLKRLKEDKHIKLGVISNASPKKANYELEVFNLQQYFDCKIFLGSISQDIAKPEPNGIIQCLQELDTFIEHNNHVCYVGDSEIDILAGKRADIFSIYIVREHNNNVPKYQPDLIINSLFELFQFLN